MNTTNRLGTVCMLLDDNMKNLYTIGTITQKSLQTKTPAQQKTHLISKIKQNLTALRNQVKHISDLPVQYRCFRISSNLLPMYDHPEYSKFYSDSDVKQLVQTNLLFIGCLIKDNDIMVGMHPDQYCIINSLKPDVCKKAVSILEYHSDIGQMMGLESEQFNINVHLYSKNTDMSALQDLREYTRKCLSFENGDKSGDMDSYQTLDICERHGIRALFDIHHHRVVTGELLQPENDLVQCYINTWDDRAPLFHISQGKTHDRDNKHSDFVTDNELVTVISEYLKYGCVEVEAKCKNHAVKLIGDNLFFRTVLTFSGNSLE